MSTALENSVLKKFSTVIGEANLMNVSVDLKNLNVPSR